MLTVNSPPSSILNRYSQAQRYGLVGKNGCCPGLVDPWDQSSCPGGKTLTTNCCEALGQLFTPMAPLIVTMKGETARFLGRLLCSAEFDFCLGLVVVDVPESISVLTLGNVAHNS